MISRITEEDLAQQVVGLASHTYRKILSAGLHITDFEKVAELFNLTVKTGELPEGKDGSYLKDRRQIILSSKITTLERINFTFCHELMHARIEDDDDILSGFADAHRRSDEVVMERLCNAGAAELLMPSEDVRQYACSVALIPELCERFSASSIAVALKMVNCATDIRYLVVAEMRLVKIEMPMFSQLNKFGESLVVAYGVKSPSAPYQIRRNRILPSGHGLYQAVEQPDQVLEIEADVPIGKNPWPLPCDCLHYRQKVFAFFRERPKVEISPDQMTMF